MAHAASKERIVRRTTKQARNVAIEIEVQSRTERDFFFEIPDDFGFDHEDSDDIKAALLSMVPEPESVQMPVPSGLGDLVSSTFVVTFVDDERADSEIIEAIKSTVRSALRPRTWRFHVTAPRAACRGAGI